MNKRLQDLKEEAILYCKMINLHEPEFRENMSQEIQKCTSFSDIDQLFTEEGCEQHLGNILYTYFLKTIT